MRNNERPRMKRGVTIDKYFGEKRGVSGGMDERVGMERHAPAGDVGRHWVVVIILLTERSETTNQNKRNISISTPIYPLDTRYH